MVQAWNLINTHFLRCLSGRRYSADKSSGFTVSSGGICDSKNDKRRNAPRRVRQHENDCFVTDFCRAFFNVPTAGLILAGSVGLNAKSVARTRRRSAVTS